MGLLQELAGHPLAQQFQTLGLGSQVAIGFGAFIFLSVFLNVANQLLFANPNEPPMVFHWFPFIGSTVIYGMDPPKFFKDNRAKVSLQYTSDEPIELRAPQCGSIMLRTARVLGRNR